MQPCEGLRDGSNDAAWVFRFLWQEGGEGCGGAGQEGNDRERTNGADAVSGGEKIREMSTSKKRTGVSEVQVGKNGAGAVLSRHFCLWCIACMQYNGLTMLLSPLCP